MSENIQELLIRNLRDVFGERDPARRRAALEALFTADCRFADPHGHGVGQAELDGKVAALQAKLPEYAFAQIDPAQAIHDSGRLAWSFGPPDDPRRVTGLDVAVVRDGRISALYTFLDEPARR